MEVPLHLLEQRAAMGYLSRVTHPANYLQGDTAAKRKRLKVI